LEKGYQNEEGFDDEEGDILGMIEYAISESRRELKKKVVEKIKKMRKPDIWKYTGWDTPEINISKDEFRQHGIDGYNEALEDILNLL